MPADFFKYLFLFGLIVEEVIRAPHRRRHRQELRGKKLAESRLTPLDFTLDLLAFAGMLIIPVIYVFTSWLDFADYALPAWVSVLGALVLAGAVWLLWRAHADLGRNWTPALQVASEHTLVTQGVYARVRHPIYAAVWLTALAQVLMLPNWIAGPACLVLFLPVYLVRVPREEQMLLDHFGEAYRAYSARTGRVVPRR
jgi:protein-S-isoprenylcysteine O-methyltransferase Ste14